MNTTTTYADSLNQHITDLEANIETLTSQRDELLAACKLALDKLETFQPEIKTPVTQKILRAAIAKAESNQT